MINKINPLLSNNPSMNIEERELIYKNIKNSICKIIINDNQEGYGFFCKIINREKSNLVPVLITNYSTLSLEYIKTNVTLKILLNEGQEIKYISLDEARINYTNEDINITIIEIKPKIDEINSFLEIDENLYENINLNEIFNNKNIYIIERPHFKRDFISITQLQNINNNTLEYMVKTAFGCLGTPIFNLENHKIIGIHMNEIQSEKNYNICLKIVIDEFIKRNEIIICMSLNNKATKNNIYFLTYEYNDNNEILQELDETNTVIFINGKKQENSKFYFKPVKKGFHIIKIKLNNLLENCYKMFSKCKYISKIDLSSFNTKNIYNMSYMFSECTNLTNINLSSLNAEKVTDISYLFSQCSNLSKIDLSSFKTKNLINMQYMFSLCINLKNINLSFFNTENVNNMNYIFSNCHSLTNLDLSYFDTRNVIYMNNTFNSCLKLTDLKLGQFNTSNVIFMEKIFYDCQSLINIDNLSSFDTKKVSNMSGMFYNCKELKNLNLSSFNTENVTNMSKMFSHCKNLLSLNLSNFKTKNVKFMQEMFSYCKNLVELNISSFETGKVEDMSEMFSFCINLIQINLYNFNLGNVNSLNKMFFSCKSLINIELNFSHINKKIDINNIFSDCYNLKRVDLSSLDINNTKNIKMIFQNCVNLSAVKVNKKSYLDFKYSILNYNFKIDKI